MPFPPRRTPGSTSRRVTVVAANFTPEVTGNAPYTSALAADLAAGGSEVLVLTTHPHYPQWRLAPGTGQWRTEATQGSLRVRRLRHYVPSSPTPVRRLLAEVSFGLRAITQPWSRPDVLIAVSPSLFSTALVALRHRLGHRLGQRLGHRRVPLVLWVQDIYSLGIAETGTSGGAVARLVAAVERWTLGAADRVVVIHQQFADHLAGSLDVEPDRLVVVRNWTHVKLAPTRSRTDERTARGWSADLVVAVHAGNQGVKQGLDNVVEAARQAAAADQPIRYVLVGGGNQHDRLVQGAAGTPTIEFIDTVDDAAFAGLLQAADVLLLNELAGLREMSVPSKLTTYFAAGRPVVAATHADSVAADELAAAGAGARVDPDDPDALNAAVLAVAADPARAAAYAAAGARHREEVLSERAALSAWADLVAGLAAGSGRAERSDRAV